MPAAAAALADARPIAAERPLAPALFASLASFCSVVGLYWDVSWHVSVGRDSFFTYPHAVIYLGGVSAGIAGAWLFARSTFGAGRSEGVTVWGMRGPVGGFAIGWGALTMLAAAPFDDFWHAAYGIDARVLSPPHVCLDIGLLTIELGALAIVCTHRSAAGKTRRNAVWAVCLAGLLMTGLLELVTELLSRTYMHTGLFYRTAAMMVPLVLVVAGEVSELRFGCTLATGLYSGLRLVMLWVLPLFHAEPRLGPVLHVNPHFVGPEFPLLLIVPALAIDLVRPRLDGSNLIHALVTGSLFYFLLLALQWPFGDFLNSPAARNAFFGCNQFGYFTNEHSPYFLGQFTTLETHSRFWLNLVVAWPLAIAMAYVGRPFGRWLANLRR